MPVKKPSTTPTIKILLGIWCVVSLFWVAAMGHAFRIGNAIDTYGTYYQKVNDINDGTATSYERRDYMNSDSDLEKAGSDFALFILFGMALPGFALWGGARLLKEKPKPTPKKR